MAGEQMLVGDVYLKFRDYAGWDSVDCTLSGSGWSCSYPQGQSGLSYTDTIGTDLIERFSVIDQSARLGSLIIGAYGPFDALVDAVQVDGCASGYDCLGNSLITVHYDNPIIGVTMPYTRPEHCDYIFPGMNWSMAAINTALGTNFADVVIPAVSLCITPLDMGYLKVLGLNISYEVFIDVVFAFWFFRRLAGG
jgi:hypothetical protein